LVVVFSLPALAEERMLQLPDGGELRYRVVTDPAESARETATQLLRHLAAGELAAAAALSNAPMRRYEVLRDYRDMVGEEEFRRVFARYQSPANRILLEAAIGRRWWASTTSTWTANSCSTTSRTRSARSSRACSRHCASAPPTRPSG
jgi:hypothetical protein